MSVISGVVFDETDIYVQTDTDWLYRCKNATQLDSLIIDYLSYFIQRREAIVRTVMQALDDNSSQTDNQQKAADIEYNSCYLQSKTLSSYNHKAAQVVCCFYLILGCVQYSAKITILLISTSLFALLIFLILPHQFHSFYW